MTQGKVIQLVELANQWMTQKTGKSLADVQKTILRQALEGRRLKDIQVPGYSPNTIKSEIAPKLWKSLSDITGRKVTIKTLHFVLDEFSKTGGIIINHSQERIRGEKRSSPSSFLFPLELPGGQIPLNSQFYITRHSAESPAYEEISKPGSLIRIKAPKQMGKTSLMARLLQQAQQQGCATVSLNFELADNEVFTALDQFLRKFFCAAIAKSLQLPTQLEHYWDSDLASKVNCTNYFEEYLLPHLDKPLALGLDKVDLIFSHRQIADDFFGLLRAWHEKAKQNSIWRNFRLIIVHGTEVYIPFSNDQSPFNVGLGVELPEFDLSQVQKLARLHQLNLNPREINQLMQLVGGHPHLVRLSLYKIARQEMTLDELLRDAATDTGIYADHLRLHLWNLTQNPQLLDALKKVVETDQAVELESLVKFKLNSMGLVYLQGNSVTTRNDLYRQYFRKHLFPLNYFNLGIKNEITPHKITIYTPENISECLGEKILAAIVFTDVKDSAYKQHNNQEQTLSLIFRDLNIMTQLCQQFEGQVLKSMGDGLLMYFVSAVKAVECAQEIQYTLANVASKLPESLILEHRIGIHWAEVFFKDNDLYGDGVNMASRIQAEAQPGGICISATVYNLVKSHLSLNVYQESRTLKGFTEPTLVYQVIREDYGNNSL
ncbi:MAG: AAA-like domain-containing protein [Microcoleaceae cyanobacterium]